MNQIDTVHPRICTCGMICVIISAQVKCLLVSAVWRVAFVVGLWMQMAHAQRALRRSSVRKMARLLRTWMEIEHAERALRRNFAPRMAGVRRPLRQAIDLRPTIVQSGFTNPIEQTGAKRGNTGLPHSHHACKLKPLTSALHEQLLQQRFFVSANKANAVSARRLSSAWNALPLVLQRVAPLLR